MINHDLAAVNLSVSDLESDAMRLGTDVPVKFSGDLSSITKDAGVR